MTSTPTLPNIAGRREPLGTLPVDSGTMTLGDLNALTALGFDSEYPDTGRYGKVTGNVVASQSGYGDGVYELSAVRGPDGTLLGFEVTFLLPEAEDQATAEVPDPRTADEHDRMREAYQNRNEPEHAALIERVNSWLRDHSAAYNRAWDALQPTINPADRLFAWPLGTIEIGSQVAAGDPCYGGPTRTADAPAGTYQAIAWLTSEIGDIARLGIYLQQP